MRISPACAAVLTALCALTARAASPEFFPNAHELFKPLRADPRELQYALRTLVPVSRKWLGEAAIGDYLGLVRWPLPWQNAKLQVSGGGGFFGRFDLSGTSNDMESADFYANLPLDLRVGKWSSRLMLYHTSSHLGDDYLKKTGLTTAKHSWDNLKWLLSYEPVDEVRFYGGYNYTFRTLPLGLGRNALQAGVECQTPWMARHWQYYWANDFQSWQRIQWNPWFNSQLGVRVQKSPSEARSVSFFLEFGTGHQPQGQFFLQQETHWGLGIKFDLS